MGQADKVTPPRRGRVRMVLGRLAGPLVVVAALVGVSVLVAVLPEKRRDKPARAAAPVNVKVRTVRPRAEVHDTLDLHAIVEPESVVTVSAEVDGRIEWVGPSEGQTVEKGDDLVRLNTDFLKAERDRAKAEMDHHRGAYDRAVKATRGGAASGSQLDMALKDKLASAAAFAIADARYRRAVIRAPMRGTVEALPVEAGEYVRAGTPVARLVNVEKVKVVMNVPERDVPFLSVGDTGTIFLGGESDQTLTGRIGFIGAEADRMTQTARVEMTVPNPPRAMPDGRKRRALRSGIVKVRLTRRVLRGPIMVPLDAVIPLAEHKAVYVVVDGLAKRLEVELGIMKGWEVQITRGLKPGDDLIVDGHRFVAPHQAVRVERLDAATTASAPASQVSPPPSTGKMPVPQPADGAK